MYFDNSVINPSSYHNRKSSHQKQSFQGSPIIINDKNYTQQQLIQSNNQISSPVSFARNFKGRLFNADPQIQREKQQKMKVYRQQLQRQMEANQKKKNLEKQKIQEEDAKWQRDFYQKVKLQAQNNKQKKQQPSYFIVRSAQKNRNKLNKLEQSPPLKIVTKNQPEQVPKPKISRKAYLQNYISTHKVQQPPNPQEIKQTKDKGYQQQRIAKILLFQQDMLKKLQNLKLQIKNTNSHLQTHHELQSIRLKIKSKPIMLPQIEKQTHTFDFYHLPKKQKHQLSSINQSIDFRPKRQIKRQEKLNVSMIQNQIPQIQSSRNKTQSQNYESQQNDTVQMPIKSRKKSRQISPMKAQIFKSNFVPDGNNFS